MRYPTRAFQSDTTVVSNDRRRHHRVSQTKAAPAPTGAAFTYPLDRSAYISGSQIRRHILICRVMSMSFMTRISDDPMTPLAIADGTPRSISSD